MTLTDFEVIDLEQLVGDLGLPCDYRESGGFLRLRSHGPAAWIGHLKTCGCGTGGERLICQECHDMFMSPASEFSCLLCGTCDEAFIPARTAFARFERIEKR